MVNVYIVIIIIIRIIIFILLLLSIIFSRKFIQKFSYFTVINLFLFRFKALFCDPFKHTSRLTHKQWGFKRQLCVMYTICTRWITSVCDVYYLYEMYTICTRCILSVRDVYYLYEMYTIFTWCILSVRDVYYLFPYIDDSLQL